MSDQAHAYTDEKLDEIEKRVAREYSAALSQLREKMESFEEWYEKENAKWRKLVEKGERTQEQYDKWLKGQALTSKLWRDRVDAMASDLTNSAQVSMAIVNGELPDVYAENHNWGTYEVEHGTTVNTMYTLYDRDTVSKLIRDGDFLYPQAAVDVAKDKLWNRRHITSAITQGILQGESITDIAKRLRNVAAMSSATAVRAARTCTTAAENAGRVDSYKRANDMGIEVKKQWLSTLDTRTRSSHRKLDGESVEIDGEFSNGLKFPGDPDGPGSEVYNCRCTLVADLAEFPAEDVDRASKLSDMSYDEWRESKETKREKPKKVKAGKVKTTKSGKTKIASTDQEVKQPGTTSMRTSYTQRELKDMDRSQLEAIAREVARKMASDQGISEEEALRRFELLIDAQTDAQLRQYINRNGK